MSPYVNLRNKEEWNKTILHELSVFDRICEEHDIPWFLEGGSVLGAIRHRGFIPWDNDIDISLLEEDYQKLREVYLAGAFPEPYILQDNEINPDYPTDFPRFIDTSTTALLGATALSNTPSGVQFDIFRLLPLPDDEEQRDQAVIRYIVLGELIHPYHRRYGSRPKEFWVEYEKALEEIEAEGRETVLNRRKQEFYSGENTTSEWLLLGSAGMYNGYPLKRRSWYQDPPIRVPFEEYELPVPTASFRMLRQHYGDSFRHFPDPQEKWSAYLANGNVPEHVIKEDFMRLYDRDAFENDLVVSKEKQMELTVLRPSYSFPVYYLRAELALQKMRDAIEVLPDDYIDTIWKALRSDPATSQALATELFGEDDSSCSTALSDYISTVFDPKYGYWRIAIPMKPEELMVCLGFLLLRRRPFWDAKRLLSRTEGGGSILGEGARELLESLETIGEILLAMDEERFTDVDELLSKVEACCPCLLEVAQAQMWLASRAIIQACKKRILKRRAAASLAAEFNEDGDVLSLYADYLWLRRRKKKAITTYVEAREKTTNGLTLLHIKDRLAGEAS